MYLQKLPGGPQQADQDLRLRHEPPVLQDRLLQEPDRVPPANQVDGMGIGAAGTFTYTESLIKQNLHS